MKPLFVLFVQLGKIFQGNTLFFWSASFRHSLIANFGVTTKVDESIKLEIAQGFEEISRPVFVNGPLRLRHESGFEAVSRENVAMEKIVKGGDLERGLKTYRFEYTLRSFIEHETEDGR